LGESVYCHDRNSDIPKVCDHGRRDPHRQSRVCRLASRGDQRRDGVDPLSAATSGHRIR
jgi:hypothetical protein